MRDIRIIVCINKNYSIGNGNDLMYHLSNDLKRFKELTNNNIVVMGRKTYESLPKKPLPNRINVILTSNKDYNASGCIIKTSIKDVLELYDNYYPDKILYIIGGGEIYKQFLDNDLVDTMEITIVDDDSDGKVKFPNFMLDSKWKVVNEGEVNVDEKTNLKYHFLSYKRKK